jgi:hypothetical protein
MISNIEGEEDLEVDSKLSEAKKKKASYETEVSQLTLYETEDGQFDEKAFEEEFSRRKEKMHNEEFSGSKTDPSRRSQVKRD